MHPALDELIAVRDGSASPEAAAHAAACPECRAEVARLRALQESLRALPVRPPSRDLWPAALRGIRRGRRSQALRAAAAAACLLAAVTAGLYWRGREVGTPAPAPPREVPPTAQPSPPPPAVAPQERAPQTGAPEVKARPEEAKPALPDLISQSQLLERLLEGYESRSPVMSSRSAGALADLQDRVALIDLQIAMAEDGQTPKERVAELWEYRVRLLASMVEIHSSRGAYTRI